MLEYDPSTEADASDIIIPVGDAYNSFIANRIVDMDHFSSEDAKDSEKEVYAVFQKKKSAVLPQIMSELRNADASVYR